MQQYANRHQQMTRYQAISEEMLRNGQESWAAWPQSLVCKAADAQAARNRSVMTAGGDYQANSAFRYTPLGIGSVTANSDGSYNMNMVVRGINGIAP